MGTAPAGRPVHAGRPEPAALREPVLRAEQPHGKGRRRALRDVRPLSRLPGHPALPGLRGRGDGARLRHRRGDRSGRVCERRGNPARQRRPRTSAVSRAPLRPLRRSAVGVDGDRRARDGPSSRPAGHTTARGEARQDGPARRLRSQPLRQQREDAVPELVAVQRHSLGFRRRYARVHQRPHGRVHRSALGAPGRQLPDADTRERQRARLRSRAGPGRQRRADAPAHGRGDRRPPPGLRQSGSHG